MFENKIKHGLSVVFDVLPKIQFDQVVTTIKSFLFNGTEVGLFSFHVPAHTYRHAAHGIE